MALISDAECKELGVHGDHCGVGSSHQLWIVDQRVG
jgi:hypothetical protein